MEKSQYEFSQEKNQKLKEQRGISFDVIIDCINNGCLVDTIRHHNQEKYEGQKFYVVDVEGYAYLVPFEEDGNTVILKTIFPSRKHTKKHIGKKKLGGNENE